MPRITPINWKKLECIFLKFGFTFHRQEGDHKAYTKKGVLRPVIIPIYKEIGLDIIQSNMRTAKMDRETYFKLLKEC